MCRKRYTYTGTEDAEIPDRFILFYSFYFYYFGCRENKQRKIERTSDLFSSDTPV